MSKLIPNHIYILVLLFLMSSAVGNCIENEFKPTGASFKITLPFKK